MESDPREKTSDIAAAVDVSHGSAAQYLHSIGYQESAVSLYSLWPTLKRRRKEWVNSISKKNPDVMQSSQKTHSLLNSVPTDVT